MREHQVTGQSTVQMLIILFLFLSKLDTRNMVKTSYYLYLNNEIYFTNLWKCSWQVPNESTGQNKLC